MRATYSRPDKLTDAQTIMYEIDMLRFAASRLLRGKWEAVRTNGGGATIGMASHDDILQAVILTSNYLAEYGRGGGA